MDDQKTEQSLIESFEDDGPGLWLPKGQVITQQPLTSPPRNNLVQNHSEQPVPLLATPTKETVTQKTPEKTVHVSKKFSNTLESSNVSESTIEFSEKSRSDSEKCEDVSDLSYSRASHISAIERERHISDKFNGILYHVIPTYNQIAILFSTKGLYSQFIASMEKELHSKSQNKEKPRFETHLNGQKCIISCDQSESCIVVTGPGRSIWRESSFLRMSLRLFNYFAADNIVESSITYGTQSLTSTPADQLRHQTHTNILMSPIPLSEPIQNINCEELNKQLNMLTEVVKTLQGQINRIQDFMGELSQKVNNIQQCKDSIKSSEPEESVIVLPETAEISAETMRNLFNEKEPPIFPGTFSYSTAAATNIKNQQNKEQQTKTNRSGSKNSQNNQSKRVNKSTDKPIKTVISRKTTASKTLLIGDSILSGINKKGLNKNVECHPISGATVEILMDKIQIFDLKCFENIIIYVAGNDSANIISDTDFEFVEEKYEQLLNHIREKSAESNIYLCSLCPRGDTSVKEVNDMIKRQCEYHQGTFIDVHKAFYNKHNQLKNYFYKPRDNIHLSASGTRGLLGAINTHIDIVDNFKSCALSGFSSQFNKKSQGKKQHRYNQHPGDNNRYNQHPSDNNRYNQHPSDNNNEQCFKCGLTNHKTHQCFHKNQVQCFLCKFFGHKDKFCWNQ